MKITDARIGMHVEYLNGKHNVFGSIIRIDKYNHEHQMPMIFIHLDDCSDSNGGILGSHSDNFKLTDYHNNENCIENIIENIYINISSKNDLSDFDKEQFIKNVARNMAFYNYLRL